VAGCTGHPVPLVAAPAILPGGFLVTAGRQDCLRFLEDFGFTGDDLDHLRRTQGYDAQTLRAFAGLRFTGEVHAVPEGRVVFAWRARPGGDRADRGGPQPGDQGHGDHLPPARGGDAAASGHPAETGLEQIDHRARLITKLPQNAGGPAVIGALGRPGRLHLAFGALLTVGLAVRF